MVKCSFKPQTDGAKQPDLQILQVLDGRKI